jgi:hypothetical protein
MVSCNYTFKGLRRFPMKYFSLTAAIILLASLGVLGSPAAKVDFSGSWTLDKAASEGIPPQITGFVLGIKQAGDKIDIQGTITTEAGEETLPDTIVVDGKTNDYTPRGPGGLSGTGKRTAKWSSDGKSLDIEEDVKFDSPEGSVSLHSSRHWSLSADGKTLTITQDITGDPGPQHIKRVLTKK